jgi:hypothetical protein
MRNHHSFWTVLFGIVVGGLALWVMTSRIHERSRHDKWYQNLDMDINLVEDALRLNAGTSAALVEQPGMPMQYGLALFYRWRHAAGDIPATNLSGFMQSIDPIAEMPAYIGVGRSYSRVLVILVILGAAASIWMVSGRSDWALISIPLFSAAGGLYFHGLLVRPELLCVAFGCFGTFGFGALFFRSTNIVAKHAWLLATGAMLGLAYLTKLPGLLYFLMAIGVFALAWIARDEATSHGVSFGKPDNWTWWLLGLLPLAAVGGAFWLSHQSFNPAAVGSLERIQISVERLRLVSAVVAILTAGSLITAIGKRSWLHLLRAIAVLLAGALASLLISHAFIRLILPERDALYYDAKILCTLFSPGDTLTAYASNPNILREIGRFLAYDSWLLIIAGILWFCSAFRLERRSLLHLAFVALWGASLGMVILMSKRYFIAQYVVFVELPLIASIALSVGIILDRWSARRRIWIVTALGIAVVWASGFTHGQMNSLYANYQCNAFDNREYRTLFIYNHGFHTYEWKQGLEKRYAGNIQTHIDAFLANPKNHYAP